MPASSYVNRDHAGGAVDTTISSGINGSALSIAIADPTGWPSGGGSGPFHVIVSYDLAGKEKIEIQSRTGNTLTVADTGKRGIDGTAAATHSSGAKIRHCYTAIDAQESNDHITNVGLDHHTQYLNTARHLAILHTAAMLGTDSVISAKIQAGAVTAGKIGVGGISAANQFAAGVVDSAALANLGVATGDIADLGITTAKIADLNVTTAKIADLGVTSGKLAANSVIAGKINTGGVSASAQLADAIVTMAKLGSEASIAYDPNFDLHNVTLGTGGVQYGQYFKFGRLMFGIAGFALGTGGSVSGPLGFEIPFASVDRFTGHGSAGTTGWLAVGRCFQNPGGANASSGLGGFTDAAPGVAQSFVTAGTAAGWDNNTPFTWNADDVFQGFFAAEAAS